MFEALLVPCGDPEAVAAAGRSGAGALLLDLGGADAPGDRAARRAAATGVLLHRSGAGPSRRGPFTVAVRVAPLASGLLDADLDGVMAGAPDAVLLPGAVGARDVQHLAAKLAVREAEHGIPAGRTRVVAMAADTPVGVLALGTLVGASFRLAALGWDPAALAGALGTGLDGSPLRTARDLLLTASAAAGVPALDCGPPGGDAAARAARRDGFAGRLVRAVHPRAFIPERDDRG